MTQAEEVFQEDGQEYAAHRIVRLLREGPHIRVGLVVANQEVLRYKVLDGPRGILTLHQDEFLVVRPNIHMTHNTKATIKCFTYRELHASNMGRMMGHEFSLLVFDTHETSLGEDAKIDLDDIESRAIKTSLRLAPREVVRAHDGYIVAKYFPEGGEGS